MKNSPKGQYPEIEEELLRWVRERRSQDQCVSGCSIKLKARQIFLSHESNLTQKEFNVGFKFFYREFKNFFHFVIK